MSLFDGVALSIIKPMGGLVAGQPKTYQLWVTNGVVSVTKKEDVSLVDAILEEFKQLEPSLKASAERGGEVFNTNEELKTYVQYRLVEEGW